MCVCECACVECVLECECMRLCLCLCGCARRARCASGSYVHVCAFLCVRVPRAPWHARCRAPREGSRRNLAHEKSAKKRVLDQPTQHARVTCTKNHSISQWAEREVPEPTKHALVTCTKNHTTPQGAERETRTCGAVEGSEIQRRSGGRPCVVGFPLRRGCCAHGCSQH